LAVASSRAVIGDCWQVPHPLATQDELRTDRDYSPAPIRREIAATTISQLIPRDAVCPADHNRIPHPERVWPCLLLDESTDNPTVRKDDQLVLPNFRHRGYSLVDYQRSISIPPAAFLRISLTVPVPISRTDAVAISVSARHPEFIFKPTPIFIRAVVVPVAIAAASPNRDVNWRQSIAALLLAK
jgi:hypothetical protein